MLINGNVCDNILKNYLKIASERMDAIVHMVVMGRTFFTFDRLIGELNFR